MSKNTFLSYELSETHVKCRITKFLDLPSNSDYCLESDDFFMCNEKWYIQIFPNKLDNGTQYIGLFLGKRSCIKGLDYCVSFKLSIKRTNGSILKAQESKHTFTVKKDTWGWFKFLERDALKSKDILAPDGSLTVFCTLLTVDNMKAGTDETLSENFKDLYISKSFSDATIVVKGREFPVHRNVLAARSKVFDSMFKLDMVEKQTGKVEIEDCDPDSFEKFLLFLYSGKLDDVSWSHAINIYNIADKYDLPNLKTECVQHLTNTICVDSFCDVIRLATIHNETKLQTAAEMYFINNVKAILSNEKWKKFIVQYPLLSNELFINFVDKNGN